MLTVAGTVLFAFVMWRAHSLHLPTNAWLNSVIGMMLLTLMYGGITFVALVIARYMSNLIVLSMFKQLFPPHHVMKMLDKKDPHLFVLLYFTATFNWYSPGALGRLGWAVFYAFLIFHFFKSFSRLQKVELP